MSSTTEKTNSTCKTAWPHVETTEVQLKRIVVGTDFSAPSQCALQIAGVVADDFDAQVSLVHAVYPTPYDPGDQPFPYSVLERTLQNRKTTLAKDVQDQPALQKRNPKTFVGYGDPVEMICQVAHTQLADLIILGTHGAKGLERLTFGSVAESVLRQASCPVLLVGPHCKPQRELFRSIIFATDLKNPGMRSAQYAATLAERAHGKLVSLHVLRPQSGTPIEEQARQHRQAVHDLAMLLPDNFPSQCTGSIKVEVGEPTECIEVLALLECATLIILGVGKRGGLADHSPWSTLAHVARQAQCPVLAIRSHLQ